MTIVQESDRPPARHVWLTVAFCVGLMVLSFVFLLATGASLRASVGIVIVVSLQALGGAAIWHRLRAEAGLLELVGMGLALGTVLSVIAGLLARVAFNASWGWLLPTAIVLVSFLISRLRGVRVRVSSTDHLVDRASLLALVVAAVVGAASLVGNIRNYPLSWEGLWGGYHPDMPFFEALSTSLARFGPFDSIFLPGAEVRYHWLVYAWSGQVSEVVGAEGFVMLTRGLQLVAVLASSLLVIAWARRLTHRLLTPTLAVLLLLAGGYVGVTYGGILNFDSPSQSMGVVWLLATSLALITFVQRSGSTSRGVSLAWLLLIAVLGFATTGGKISAAAPALLGAALMTGLGLIVHAPWAKRALHGTLALFAGSLLAYFLIISGANGGGGLALGALVDRASSQQGINPMEGPLGVILGTGIMVIAIALRWTGLFWLGSIRENRSRPDVIFAFGLAIAGFATVVLFNGFNEIWFATAASAPLAVFAAEGFESALDRLVKRGRRSPRTLVGAAVVLALVVVAVVWAIWLTGPSGGSYWRQTWRWAGPFAAIWLGLIFAWLVVRWAGISRDRRSLFAGFTIIVVLVVVPMRLLGIGSGQIGVPAGLRADQFSFGNGEVIMGNDSLLMVEIPSGFMSAGTWLRENASPFDLLATNLTFGPLVPAVTGFQTYASAIRYQSPYGRPSATPELLQHDEEVWGFINAPSAASVTPLCEAGVRWVWVEPSETKLRNWQPYGTTVFENGDAIILELTPAACG
jgi:hypothetical protein